MAYPYFVTHESDFKMKISFYMYDQLYHSTNWSTSGSVLGLLFILNNNKLK